MFFRAGLNTIYAVANYDTPLGREILENDIQSLNDVNLYKGKDVFVVQYGKNDNKLFVTTMNSNESNFQKLQNHTATWTNANQGFHVWPKICHIFPNFVPSLSRVCHAHKQRGYAVYA